MALDKELLKNAAFMESLTKCGLKVGTDLQVHEIHPGSYMNQPQHALELLKHGFIWNAESGKLIESQPGEPDKIRQHELLKLDKQNSHNEKLQEIEADKHNYKDKATHDMHIKTKDVELEMKRLEQETERACQKLAAERDAFRQKSQTSRARTKIIAIVTPVVMGLALLGWNADNITSHFKNKLNTKEKIELAGIEGETKRSEHVKEARIEEAWAKADEEWAKASAGPRTVINKTINKTTTPAPAPTVIVSSPTGPTHSVQQPVNAVEAEPQTIVNNIISNPDYYVPSTTVHNLFNYLDRNPHYYNRFGDNFYRHIHSCYPEYYDYIPSGIRLRLNLGPIQVGLNLGGRGNNSASVHYDSRRGTHYSYPRHVGSTTHTVRPTHQNRPGYRPSTGRDVNVNTPSTGRDVNVNTGSTSYGRDQGVNTGGGRPSTGRDVSVGSGGYTTGGGRNVGVNTGSAGGGRSTSVSSGGYSSGGRSTSVNSGGGYSNSGRNVGVNTGSRSSSGRSSSGPSHER